MDVKDIQDVLDLQVVLGGIGWDAISREPKSIAALLEWKHRDDGKTDIVATVDPPKAKRGKGVEVPDDSFEPTPDPASDEPDF
jgi:hypothetical protein